MGSCADIQDMNKLQQINQMNIWPLTSLISRLGIATVRFPLHTVGLHFL